MEEEEAPNENKELNADVIDEALGDVILIEEEEEEYYFSVSADDDGFVAVDARCGIEHEACAVLDFGFVSSAVCAKHRHHFAGMHRQINALEDRNRAIPGAQLPDCKQIILLPLPSDGTR